MHRKETLIAVACGILAVGSGWGRPQDRQSADPKSAYLQTMGIMVRIAAAVKNYSIDFGCVPKVSTAPELKKLLDGFYITHLPRDAWGRDFFYRYNEKDSGQCWLASAGSDGVFRGFEQSGRWSALDGQDVILTNKPPSWIYAPAIGDWALPDLEARLGADSGSASAPGFFTRLNPDAKPGIVRHPAPFIWDKDGGQRGFLASFPDDKSGGRDPFAFDFRGYDLSKLDVGGRLTELLRSSFDDHTIWPSRRPEGFDPARFLEIGRNPGLGVRELHKRGITGKGVAVAIIDMGFLVDHVEYKDRVRHFEEIHSADETAQMHGVACASIAVGQTVGVAPEADLYYIASFPASGDESAAGRGRDFTWDAQAVDRILEVNRTLPEGRKIRVVSMSIGWGPTEAGFADIMAAVERAKQAGVFVVCTSMERTYGFILFGLGRDPLKNPDRFDSFGEGSWGGLYPHESPGGKEALLFPMDARTTASPTGADKYVFYGMGGLSWSVPWAAGLYALACQVKPDVTPDLFWKKALETGDVVLLPPKWPDPTPEEIEARVQKRLDERMKELKAREGENFENFMARAYRELKGQKADQAGESEFRALLADRIRPAVVGETRPHELKKIVNPARLMDALRAGKS